MWTKPTLSSSCLHARKFIRKRVLFLCAFVPTLISVYLLVKFLEDIFWHQEADETNKSRSGGNFMDQVRSIARTAVVAPLITFTNVAQKGFVKSFVCNLLTIGGSTLASQFVVIVSDNETLDDLRTFNADITVLLKPFDSDKNLTYGTEDYEDYIEYRTSTVLEILGSDVPLILIDSDHYWIKSPLEWLSNQTGHDMIVENDSMPPAVSVCAGFLYFNNTNATRTLWSKIDQHTKFFRSFPETKHIHEQSVLSSTLLKIGETKSKQRRKQRDARRSRIDELWELADQKYPTPERLKWTFFPHGNVVSGLWYAEEEFRNNFLDIWTIHNNWYVGNNEKKERAQSWGHWMLDDQKNACKDD